MSVEGACNDNDLAVRSRISGLSDSRFRVEIKQTLTERTAIEATVSALFYVNLSTFLGIALAANALSIEATTDYLLVAYSFVFIAFMMQKFPPKRWLEQKRISNNVFFSYIALLEESAIVVALFFNGAATHQASPQIAIVCVCAATFLSLPVSTRLFESFTLSKCAIFLGCIAYVLTLDNNDSGNVIMIFPLIITFVFIFSTGYWLYLRQVKILHQQYEEQYLRRIIQSKNQMLSDAIVAEKIANDELSQAHSLREKIIRHIGHDLRQPINALTYSLFNLDKNTLDERHREAIDIAKKSVDTANYLIEEVLQISTYKKTELTANLESFELGYLLNIIEREYAVAAKQAGSELHIAKCSLKVVSDFQLVSRIVKNFLSNAIRYADGKKILIGVRRRGDFVEIQIIDAGPGIPLDIRAQLFEEFVIGANATGQESFGLGLSIAKHLASICDGYVSIASTIDKGTRCSLFLPLAAK